MNKALTITIFGCTGDLTFRKLLPALYNMYSCGKLKTNAKILGIGRRELTTKYYVEMSRDWVRKYARISYTEEKFDAFSKHIVYLQMDFSDTENYKVLDNYFKTNEESDKIFYFAVAPRFFHVIANGLKNVYKACEGKIVLEKPFGENLASAKTLNEELEKTFSPNNIYRIDHYLGKEMVRGILAIRFTNPIFSNIWNAKNIDYILISAMEELGVKSRGSYYDHSGALSDMVQNHLFQILSIVAMERPKNLFGEDMKIEQINTLKSLRSTNKISIKNTLLLAQYEGYKKEPDVNENSTTETYAALRLYIDNERWKDMPFYIRTGKNTNRREMEVIIAFKPSEKNMPQNILAIKIQPTEGVYLQFNIKEPGDSEEITQAKMDFCQNCVLKYSLNTPEAYERLLDACIKGELAWFSKWSQIEVGWSYIENLKQMAKNENLEIYSYTEGSEGPKEMEELLEKPEHKWINV